MRMISNSEVNSWLQCTRKYYYEYVLGLEPKVYSEAISKGIIIHSMLEGYYAGKMQGLDEAACREEATEPLLFAMASGGDIAELGGIRTLVEGYFDKSLADEERYEVRAVETKYALELSESFSLVGTLDLLLFDKWDAKYIPVDHKSTYNFWTDEQVNTSAQFVKYIIILRGLGYDVGKFMVNQIRTRPVKNGDLYQRAWADPSDSRLKAVLRQHVDTSNKIVEFHRNGADHDATIPVFDKYICSNCPFLSLCNSDTEGQVLTFQINQEYQKRTSYGYNMEPTNV